MKVEDGLLIKALKQWVKWGLWLIWLVAMILIGAKLAQQNQSPVQLTLLVWRAPEASAGVVFGLVLFIGAIIGWLACLPTIYGLKRKARKSERKLRAELQPPAHASLPKE